MGCLWVRISGGDLYKVGKDGGLGRAHGHPPPPVASAPICSPDVREWGARTGHSSGASGMHSPPLTPSQHPKPPPPPTT